MTYRDIKNKMLAIGLMASMAVGLTACLSDDETEVVTYKDTGITAFSLGSLKRTMHTTSSQGEDSTYTVSVTGSSYKFYIDQQQGLIYNVDSLPVGTSLSRVLCTVSSKNAGVVIVNLRTSDGTKDSLVYYSSTDSLDFTKPLEFRVYNTEGTAWRRYVATVNVKQTASDELLWKQPQLSDDELSQLLDRLIPQPVTVEELIGDDQLDAPADWLPTQNLNLVSQPLRTNDDAVRRVLVGNRSVADFPADTTAMVWSRIVETSKGSEVQPWLFYTPDTTNPYLLPRLENLQVAATGNILLAIGGPGLGACTAEAYQCFYESRDGGITWRESTTYAFPDAFDKTKDWLLGTDDDGTLWLVSTDGQQAWQGRVTR